MSHSFIQNCRWITLQVSHHEGWTTEVKNGRYKLIFRGTWNSLMAWADWPWPPYFTTDLCYWSQWAGASMLHAQWLKWFCEAGGSPDEARLEQTLHTHPNSTNLALFRRKIAFYRFNQGGSYYCRGAQMGAGGWAPPSRVPLTLTTDATKFWRLLHARTQYEKQQLQICVVIKLDARKIISTLSTANADARSAYDS